MSTELRAVEHEDGHVTYYVGDLRCWSITGALRAAGKQKSFDGVPTFYRDRGKAVARAIELHELGDLDEDSIDPTHVRPRLDQWRRFVDREVAQVLGVELVCWAWAAEGNPFVAILDAVVRMKDGTLRVIDAKCGKNARSYELQTAAQTWALNSMMVGRNAAHERGVLELGERDYRWVPHRKSGDYAEVLEIITALGPRNEWDRRNAA
jgi:hypothetical protein